MSGIALGQAKGTVQSVGYEGWYRANTWTPLRVVLVPTTGNAEELRLEVVQEDLDRDPVKFYSAPFVLTGNSSDGRPMPQTRWMYFIPQPSGLDTGGDPAELTRKLRVFVCTAGKKRIMQLPMSGVNLQGLDSAVSGGGGFGSLDHGRRLVLVVVDRDNPDRSPVGVYDQAVGLTEVPTFVTVNQDELPDNVIGYQSVDTVLWMNADPQHKVSSTAVSALRDWVREGGRLVVCQNEFRCQENAAGEFGEMLPVSFPEDRAAVQMLDNDLGLWALRRLARTVLPPELGSPARDRLLLRGKELDQFKLDEPFCLPRGFTQLRPGGGAPVRDPWEHMAWEIEPRTAKRLKTHTFAVAQAQVKAGASVEFYADPWNRTPYLVRGAFGAGSVTWVAQDLGKAEFHNEHDPVSWYGWARVWDRLFDWRNKAITTNERRLVPEADGEAKRLELPPNGLDVSGAIRGKMELPTRGAALVGLAMLFFIAYWVVAGPVSYFALLKKKLATLSWPAFALCAVAGTALTVLVVRVVLRGSPELQHVTFVRIAPGEDTVIHSHFGLYIPRDGSQTIELKKTDAARESHITAYPLHRKFTSTGNEGFLSNIEYEVPIPPMGRDPVKDPEPGVSVPYRSTLKKFQAKWVGKANMGIEGSGRFTDWNIKAKNYAIPSGNLVNQLGTDLHDVYIVYRQGQSPEELPDPDQLPPDRVIYLPDYRDGNGDLQPAWAKGGVKDLAYICDPRNSTLLGLDLKKDTEGRRSGVIDMSGQDWPKVWEDPLRSFATSGGEFSDMDRAAVLLALYNRLPLPKHSGDDRSNDDRVLVSRAAGRHLDASSAVAAGQILVLGRATGPLPLPLDVQGDRTAGDGVTYFQVVVPLDRSALTAKPTTQPASKPATQAASQPLERE